jgi:glycosyltransferase involved in cell wall biosynthesis
MSLGDAPGLVAAVQSLLDQPEDIEIVVVNSGGGNPSSRLAAAGISVPVLNHPERLYPGAVRNIGIEHTRAPYVAFLEGDCLALPGWAAGRLREHKAGAPAVACLMTNAYPESTTAWASHLVQHSRRTAVTPPGMRQLYGLSLDRALFDRYGTFREDLRAGEDTEFRTRLPATLSIAWSPDIVSAHRYPTDPRTLIGDSFRRGRLQAAMRGARLGTKPQWARVAFWGLTNPAYALRVVLRAKRPVRRTLLKAWLLVVPAALAFATGAISAHFRPYDGQRPAGESPAPFVADEPRS